MDYSRVGDGLGDVIRRAEEAQQVDLHTMRLPRYAHAEVDALVRPLLALTPQRGREAKGVGRWH